MLTRKNRKEIHNLNLQVLFLNISWAIHDRELYVNVIEEINDLYKNMLMIGKCNEVFWLCNDKIPDLLSAISQNTDKLLDTWNIICCFII